MSVSYNLVEAVDRCFADNGPFLTAMRSVKGFGEYRASQAEFANSFAKFLCASSQDITLSASAHDPDRPLLYSGDIATGMGKTLVYTTVSAVNRHVNNKRTIVATFTRQLREEIVREADTVNAVMNAMGLPPVSIRPYIPLSSACSLEHAAALAARYPGAKHYHEYVETCYQEGKLPLIGDFLIQGDMDFLFEKSTGKPTDSPRDILDLLTVRYNEMDRIADRIARKKKSGEEFSPVEQTFHNQGLANRETRAHADIMVVTHALLTHNAIQFGTILNTNQCDYNQAAATQDRFCAIIDEADLYHEQALNFFDLDVSISDVRDALGQKGDRKGSTGIKAVAKLEAFLKSHTKTLRNFDSDRLKDELISLLRESENPQEVKPSNETVLDAINRRLASIETGTIGFDYVTKLKLQIQRIVDWHEESGNARGASNMSDANVSLLSYQKNGTYHLTLQATDGGSVANRLWRNIKVHAIDHIALLSGTLTGKDRESVSSFYRMTGIYGNNDRAIDAIWGSTGFRVVPLKNGKMKQSQRPSMTIPLEDRSVSRIVFSDTNLLPYDRETKLLSPAYWDRVGETLEGFFENGEPDRNTLVLLTSYRTQEYLEDYFRERQIQNAVFQSPAGAAATILKARAIQARGERCVIFGLNWMGVNYVADGRTMIDRVVFPTIPYPVKRHLDEFYNSTFEDSASRKTRQGMGRAMRNNGDSPEFWFLDGRLPVADMFNDGSMPRDGRIDLSNSLFEDCLIKSRPEIAVMRRPHDLKLLRPVNRG